MGSRALLQSFTNPHLPVGSFIFPCGVGTDLGLWVFLRSLKYQAGIMRDPMATLRETPLSSRTLPRRWGPREPRGSCALNFHHHSGPPAGVIENNALNQAAARSPPAGPAPPPPSFSSEAAWLMPNFQPERPPSFPHLQKPPLRPHTPNKGSGSREGGAGRPDYPRLGASHKACC